MNRARYPDLSSQRDSRAEGMAALAFTGDSQCNAMPELSKVKGRSRHDYQGCQ